MCFANEERTREIIWFKGSDLLVVENGDGWKEGGGVVGFDSIRWTLDREVSYQLSRQEHLLLPGHRQTHAVSLLGAAQHSHQLLLRPACDVHSVNLMHSISFFSKM